MGSVLVVTALSALILSCAVAAGNNAPVRRDPAKAYAAGGSQTPAPQELKGGKPQGNDAPMDLRREGWTVPPVTNRPDSGDRPHDDHPRDERPPDNDKPRHDDHHGDKPPRDDRRDSNPFAGRPGERRDDGDHHPGWPSGHRPRRDFGPPYRPMPYYWAWPGSSWYNGYSYSPYDWVFPRYWGYPRSRDDADDWQNYDPSTPPGPHLLGRILGAEIWAADGVFLGVVDPDSKHEDSICNPEGAYGNFGSPTSILNPRGLYGAGRGPLSCWDPDTLTPPRLFWHGRFVGYLTTNRTLYPRTDPAWILHRWLSDRT